MKIQLKSDQTRQCQKVYFRSKPIFNQGSLENQRNITVSDKGINLTRMFLRLTSDSLIKISNVQKRKWSVFGSWGEI